MTDRGMTGRIPLAMIGLLTAAGCGGGGGGSASSGSAPSPPVAKAWGTAAFIETDNTDNALLPQIAIDASGNALAVWQQGDGTRDNIWANRYDATSGRWQTATLIETDNAGYATHPQVAIDGAGNGLAVWEQYDGTTSNIMANRYTAGLGWGTPVTIDNLADSAYNAQIAIDTAGNGIAVWEQSDGTDYNIMTNRYTAGVGWGTPVAIDNLAGIAYEPRIVVDAVGNGIAVWEQMGGAGVNNIHANRYDAALGTWGTAERIESATGDAYEPHVAFDAAGNAIAVWWQFINTANASRIRAARFSYDAATRIGLWETPVDISGAGGDARRSHFAIDAHGNALAVWQQDDSTRESIWANRYSAGAGWGTPTLIETDETGDALDARIAVDAAGNAVVVWQQAGGTRINIWSNRYDATSGLWGTAALIETDDAGYAVDPQIAIDSAGNAIAVWDQYDGAKQSIWANIYR